MFNVPSFSATRCAPFQHDLGARARFRPVPISIISATVARTVATRIQYSITLGRPRVSLAYKIDRRELARSLASEEFNMLAADAAAIGRAVILEMERMTVSAVSGFQSVVHDVSSSSSARCWRILGSRCPPTRRPN